MQPVSQYFGEATFGLDKLRATLPPEFFAELIRCLDQEKRISRRLAGEIAQAIKDWAVAAGATHYCHWFQPMNGLTAEKHDAFIQIQFSNHSELKVVERFSGEQLIRGEPDASAFPSGGMRSTFEARGYTAWDPSSSPFIVASPSGAKTLCIPSVFFGYNGGSLDNKTPLLRSCQALTQNAVKFLKLLGDVDAKRVSATLGAEQEYFLIDRDLAAARPDIIMTGRTLVGAPSVRGQKLEDHYFGSIPPRVKAFMEELERELFRLGIPVKTRHNEVAPLQFEMAPWHEPISIAADHNALTMETMRRVAARHRFLVLFHEKPFAEINGSGKHCNWSLSNDKGENLLDPGRTPHQNLRFLAVLSVVIRAVYQHANVLIAASTSPGNDMRLGGHEAPPSIFSVFIGSTIQEIFEAIANGESIKATEETLINLGISSLPNVARDYTDRNRTSPFAFTGTKFEYRAVGSSANVAVPMAVLNAAVAAAFAESAEQLRVIQEDTPQRQDAILALIKQNYTAAKDVLFSGNNYAPDWQEEAKRRGLVSVASTKDGLAILEDTLATQFLIDTKVLSRSELEARYNVKLEHSIKTSLIELETLCELISEYIVPAVQQELIRTSETLSRCQLRKLQDVLTAKLSTLESILFELITGRSNLLTVLDEVKASTDLRNALHTITTAASLAAQKLRVAADRAERESAHELWPFPKYRDLLSHVTWSV